MCVVASKPIREKKQAHNTKCIQGRRTNRNAQSQSASGRLPAPVVCHLLCLLNPAASCARTRAPSTALGEHTLQNNDTIKSISLLDEAETGVSLLWEVSPLWESLRRHSYALTLRLRCFVYAGERRMALHSPLQGIRRSLVCLFCVQEFFF